MTPRSARKGQSHTFVAIGGKTIVAQPIARPSSLTSLSRAARGCRACDLWKHATQTVFGEGPSTAEIMFVGEQPGDQEDLAGHPFVGPAGGRPGEGLIVAGLHRGEGFVTQVVKKLKWWPPGS